MTMIIQNKLKKFSSKKRLNEQIDLVAATIESRINVEFILKKILKIEQ